MDRDDFIREIIRTPQDDGPRLICADWLDSRGDSARAEFVRTQIELVQIQKERNTLFNDERDWKECTGISATWCPNCGDCSCREPEFSRNDHGCPIHGTRSRHNDLERLCNRAIELRTREDKLLSANGIVWLRQVNPVLVGNHSVPPGRFDRRGDFTRGFVSRIRIAFMDFVSNGWQLCNDQPIEYVEVTDKHPFPTDVPGTFSWQYGYRHRLPHETGCIRKDIYELLPAADIPRRPGITNLWTSVDAANKALSIAMVAWARAS